MQKADITADLVEELVASQFPQWAGLPVTSVEVGGWDNTTFRLGSSMSVRLPSADPYVAQVDKEHRWLPVLAPQLPVPIPVPLGRGEPTPAFPRPWSVYAWIDGDLLTLDRVPDMIDTRAAFDIWEAALDARCEAPAVWAHGDVTGTNLLVRDGRLAGVLDFGCCAVGDPACDLTIAWTFFNGESRELFKALVPVEASAWTRGRGWALWKALLHLAADQAQPGQGQRFDRRVGWRFSAQDIVAEVIGDHRCAS